MRPFLSSPFVLVRTLTAGALSVLAYGAVLGLIGVLAVVGPYREGTAFALPAGDALEQQRVQQFELGVVLSLVIILSAVHGLVTMALVWRRRSLRTGAVVIRGVLAALVSAVGGVLAFTLLSSLPFNPAWDSWMVGAAVLVVAALPVPLVWFTARWRKTEPRADT